MDVEVTVDAESLPAVRTDIHLMEDARERGRRDRQVHRIRKEKVEKTVKLNTEGAVKLGNVCVCVCVCVRGEAQDRDIMLTTTK